jgi:hypothetical protein
MTNTETQTEAKTTGNSLKNQRRADQFAKDLTDAQAADNQRMFVQIANHYTRWAKRVGYTED